MWINHLKKYFLDKKNSKKVVALLNSDVHWVKCAWDETRREFRAEMELLLERTQQT